MVDKIVIIDDEPDIIEVLSDYLEEDGYEIFSADSVTTARDQIKVVSPDLIISDFKLGDGSGIDILKWYRKSHNKPFILITGFDNIELAEQAIDEGAHSLVKKPFDEEEFKSTVREALGLKRDDKLVYTDELFCKFDINKFISGSIIQCNIFVRIREDHYVKIAAKGDPVPKDTLERYRNKNLKYLFVLKREFSDFVGLNLKILGAVKDNKKLGKEKVLNFINYTNGIIAEQTFVKELKKEDMEEVKDYANTALSILRERDSLISMLDNLNENSSYIYAHSLSTAIMCFLISKEYGWINEPVLFKVFLMGFLHDIGLKDVPEKILEKNPNLFTDEEKKLYESHPTRGMEILNSIGGIPEEVILACYQHHEDCLGHGYPQKLRKNEIPKMSRLLAVANIVEDQMFGVRDITLGTYKNAIRSVEKMKPGHYDKEFLEALKRVVKY